MKTNFFALLVGIIAAYIAWIKWGQFRKVSSTINFNTAPAYTGKQGIDPSAPNYDPALDPDYGSPDYSTGNAPGDLKPGTCNTVYVNGAQTSVCYDPNGGN